VADLRDLDLALLARAAEVCCQPWRFAVLTIRSPQCDELTLRLEARDSAGERHFPGDLELEIYRSGRELNVMLALANVSTMPLLWQGQHPVWVDADSGQRCVAPEEGTRLEGLARRIRALISPD
jgi:hypothetical protein